MTCAYDEMYLDGAMRDLGEAFDYAVNTCGLSADTFLTFFISGGLADEFGKGSPRVVSGLSGTELVMEVLLRTGATAAFPKPQTEYDCSPEYWCGWILAYYQWKTGMSFRAICEVLSMEELIKLYPILHEASEEKCAETFDRLIAKKSTVSRLQKQRKRCGYTQKELAEKSGVNLRTLQQYELKAKDIGKASVQTVRSMANVLGCQTEDILEYH